MSIQLPVGIEDFREMVDIVREDPELYAFVDKTHFIGELLKDKTTKVALITRPRRFGKTLNMSMLHYFLASHVNGVATAGLFDGLALDQQYPDLLSQHQGKYPVIFLTLRKAESTNFEGAITRLLSIIRALFRQHAYLEKSEKLNELQKDAYHFYFSEKMEADQLADALQVLSELLHAHHGKKVWVLIDEYDTPMHASYACGYYTEMAAFMGGFLSSVLKSNEYLDRAVVTGVLRVAKESLFSGFNNVRVYSLLDNKYSQYFGFTESEVDSLLKKCGWENKKDDVQQWYNGYKMGSTIIYNPWSICQFVSHEGEIGPYWVNTGRTDLISEAVKGAPALFYHDLKRLLKGEMVEQTIDDSLTLKNQELRENEKALWTLLLMSGYLAMERSTLKDGIKKIVLKIPNGEVYSVYTRLVKEWLSGSYNSENHDRFINRLLEGDIAGVENYLTKVLLEIVSCHDTAAVPECFYHGLMLGMTVGVHGDRYHVWSNRESGDGRFDLAIQARDNRLGLIFEFKRSLSENESLENCAQEALKQINEKKYDATFSACQRLLKMGVAFRGAKLAIVHTDSSVISS